MRALQAGLHHRRKPRSVAKTYSADFVVAKAWQAPVPLDQINRLAMTDAAIRLCSVQRSAEHSSAMIHLGDSAQLRWHHVPLSAAPAFGSTESSQLPGLAFGAFCFPAVVEAP